jgi:hypothetical protein
LHLVIDPRSIRSGGFERAERDEGCATCVPDKLPRTLDGGVPERIPDRVENLAAMSRDKMAFEYA